jgi:transcriptional regulator GlxA family with amidase domain
MPDLPERKVALLVLPHSSLLSVASTLDPLRCANRHLGHEAIRWTVIAPGAGAVPLTCGLSLPVMGDLAAAEGADLLVVIAGFQARALATARLTSRIARIAPRIGSVAALDSGAWLLARAGLLDGYRATTHWEDLEDFASAYPAVTVVPDRFVIDRTRLTAGGAAPAFDMMVHLIRQWHGPRIAHEVENSFITQTTPADLPQLRRPGTAGADPRVRQVVAVMEATIDRPVRVAELAAQSGLSPRRMESLFRSSFGMTPGAFYLDLRLQAACRLLADTRHPVADIAMRCGFTSPATFARAFAKRFAVSPSAFRKGKTGFVGFRAAE